MLRHLSWLDPKWNHLTSCLQTSGVELFVCEAPVEPWRHIPGNNLLLFWTFCKRGWLRAELNAWGTSCPAMRAASCPGVISCSWLEPSLKAPFMSWSCIFMDSLVAKATLWGKSQGKHHESQPHFQQGGNVRHFFIFNFYKESRFGVNLQRHISSLRFHLWGPDRRVHLKLCRCRVFTRWNANIFSNK